MEHLWKVSGSCLLVHVGIMRVSEGYKEGVLKVSNFLGRQLSGTKNFLGPKLSWTQTFWTTNFLQPKKVGSNFGPNIFMIKI